MLVSVSYLLSLLLHMKYVVHDQLSGLVVEWHPETGRFRVHTPDLVHFCLVGFWEYGHPMVTRCSTAADHRSLRRRGVIYGENFTSFRMVNFSGTLILWKFGDAEYQTKHLRSATSWSATVEGKTTRTSETIHTKHLLGGFSLSAVAEATLLASGEEVIQHEESAARLTVSKFQELQSPLSVAMYPAEWI